MASRSLALSAADLGRVREIESLARQLARLCLPELNTPYDVLTKLYLELFHSADGIHAARPDIGLVSIAAEEIKPLLPGALPRSHLPLNALQTGSKQENGRAYKLVCLLPLVRRSVFSLCIRVTSIACEMAHTADFAHAIVCVQTVLWEASLLLTRLRELREYAERLSFKYLAAPPFAAPLTADLSADLAALHRLGRAFMQPDTIDRNPATESLQRFMTGITSSKSTELNLLFHDLQVHTHQFVLALMDEKKPRTSEEWRRVVSYIYKWAKLQPSRFDPALRAYLNEVCRVIAHHKAELADTTGRLQQVLADDTRCDAEKLLCVPIVELRPQTGSYLSLLPVELMPIVASYFPSGQLDHLSNSRFGSLIARVLEYTPEEWANAFYRSFYTQLMGLHNVIGSCAGYGNSLDSSRMLTENYIRQVAELSIELNDFCTSIILYGLLAEPVSRAHRAVDQRLLRQFSALRKWVLVWPEFERRMREASSMSLTSFVPALGVGVERYNAETQISNSAKSPEFINVWTAFHRFARLPPPIDGEMELFDLISHRLVCMSTAVQRQFFAAE